MHLTAAVLATITALSAHATYVRQTACPANTSDFLKPGKVNKLRPAFYSCHNSATGEIRLATREFTKNKTTWLVTVNPLGYATRIDAKACFTCTEARADDWAWAPFIAAVDSATAGPYELRDSGLAHADHAVNGFFLTVDLCPTESTAFERDFFTRLATLSKTKTAATPVAVAVSGLWTKEHPDDFKWLRDLSLEGKLNILWVNHSYTHPFLKAAPMSANFLLKPGIDLGREILRTEEILLTNGLVPSVFFRFPGLVSNRKLMLRLRSYFLIPLGADAWLGKGEKAMPGSVVLVHGNGNEHIGIERFFRLLDRRKQTVDLLPIDNLFF